MFALNSTRPSIESHLPPSRVWTLLATATWVWRSGSPARESRWVKAVATRPRTSTWRTPSVPVRVNRALCSMKARASATAALVGLLDQGGGCGIGQRPQRRDALDRGEGEVEAGHSGGLLPGVLGDVAASSRASVGSRPCSAVKNSRATSVRIRARSVGRDRPVAGEAGGLVEGRQPSGDLDPERR